jgi:hypothetical protein
MSLDRRVGRFLISAPRIAGPAVVKEAEVVMVRAAVVGGAPAADIFERLLAGDPTAPADLAEAYLDDLTRWLIARNRRPPPAVATVRALPRC